MGDINLEGKSVLKRIWETAGWTQLAKYTKNRVFHPVVLI